MQSRREFSRWMLASALGIPWLNCKSPLPLQFAGYRGLSELPYFITEGEGELRLADPDAVPDIIDVHAHLGFSLFTAPELDLGRSTPTTHYLVDCDGATPPCTLDLDVYLNEIATPEMLAKMEEEIRASVFTGSKAAETHTLPNLIKEMDAMRVERAVILPIASGLPVRDDLTERWRQAILDQQAGARFISFCSVHPKRKEALDQLRSYKAQGFAGIKFHPTMQQVAPDDPAALDLFAECERLELPVFLHAGRAGIEPDFTQQFAEMERYRAPLEAFPRAQFIFGHAGARDFSEALPLMKRHENVWVDLHGQSVTHLRSMIAEVGTDRLLFGTDWPFYPIAASLAKVLMVTEQDPATRRKILRDNARRLLRI